MDKSYDASKSEGSSEGEWMDLSKSDYAKVIFSKLYWDAGTGDVGCCFTLTETVNKNPSDYIGIYKVGYDHLSQCLALKKLSEFQSEDESKPIYCNFKSDELPDLSGFYQFLYVTLDNEVCGASMPFEVKSTQKRESSVEEVVTERIENDFLMVRYGLEQKNYKLETLLKTYEAENEVLVDKMRKLRCKKAVVDHELDKTQHRLCTAEVDLDKLVYKLEIAMKDLEVEKAKSEEAEKARIAAEEREKEALFQLKEVSEDLAKTKQTLKIVEDKYEYSQKALESEQLEHLNDVEAYCGLVNENCNNSKQKDLLILELNKEITQVQSELISTKKLLESKREDKEEMFCVIEKELQNSYNRRDALEREVNQLKRYLNNPQEYTRLLNRETAFNQLHTTEDERLMVEQLEDSKFMIKALEDSKQLAMKEMHELSEKLRKSKEELGQIKCENMALKIFLEDKKSYCDHSEGSSKTDSKNEQTQTVHSEKLITALKKVDSTVDANNLHTKLEEIISNAQHQTEEFKKTKTELNLLRCENMALKIFLEEKTKCDTAKEDAPINVSEEEKMNKRSNSETQEDNANLVMTLLSTLKEADPSVTVENIEGKIKELVKNVQLQTEDICKLKEECKCKDEEVESLNKTIDALQKAVVNAIREVEDKTARIVQAAELYKKLYKEKEKLTKQLKKLTLLKSRTKKSSITKSQEDATPSFLPRNIENRPSSSETTSNNSDSDTGEHFRSQILYPDLRKDENYMPEALVRSESRLEAANYCNSIDMAINNLCAGAKEDQVYKAPQGMEYNSFQQLLSVDRNTYIPCCLCGKSFLVTQHSNVPMMDHLEKEHNMVMCPICGQMFDKSFPSKYLTFHINDHFKPE